MGTVSVIVVVICMVLFLFAMPRTSRGRPGADGLFFGTDASKVMVLSDTEEELMEQIWCNCKLDFFGISLVMRDLDLQILKENSADSTMFVKEDMQEALTRLYPEMKRFLFDCLIKQSLLETISREDKVGKICSSTITDLSHLSRRNLAGQTVHKKSTALQTPLIRRIQTSIKGQVSDLVQTPVLSPSPSPTPNHEVKPHTSVPSTPPSESSIPEDDQEDFSPTSLPEGYLEPEVTQPKRHFPAAPPSKEKTNNRPIIIAVVVTAIATFTLAAFCFYCCNRCAGGKYQNFHSQKDERPLLSLSLSDFSGSSQKSFGLGNSIHKDKFASSSLRVDPSHNNHFASFGSSADASSEVSGSIEPINLPRNAPIRAAPPPPPLKPPPRKNSPPSAPSAPPAPPLPLPNPKPAPLPPKGGPPPPKVNPPPPKGPHRSQGNESSSGVSQTPSNHSANADDDGTKTKLKPFFWDKVMANPDQSMVWHQIKSGSFQFNEEMIETLFGYNAADKRRNESKKDLGNDSSSQRIQILDPKKSQNLAISLKAQNVKVEEVCDALIEGNELPVELLQTLLRMAPTTDEELKLRLFNDDSVFLGPAEQFLKAIVNIPSAYKRMDALLFMTCLQEESLSVKESFATLEEACKELRSSRLFSKLLEAVLKTGNRMNDGTYRGGAQAFKLDTLLKLSDVKGVDGKTTLLHFVVQEIIHSEGRRALRMSMESRSNSSISISSVNSEDLFDHISEESEEHYHTFGLKAVSSLNGELENVKKAAGLDADALASSVASLGHRLLKTKEFWNNEMHKSEDSGFRDSLKDFVEHAEVDITLLLEKEKQIRLLVKNTTDYFHGNAGKDEGLRLFVIVRDFLGMLDKICKEVREAPRKVTKRVKEDNPTLQPIPESRQLLFPAIIDHRISDSSFDDEES